MAGLTGSAGAAGAVVTPPPVSLVGAAPAVGGNASAPDGNTSAHGGQAAHLRPKYGDSTRNLVASLLATATQIVATLLVTHMGSLLEAAAFILAFAVFAPLALASGMAFAQLLTAGDERFTDLRLMIEARLLLSVPLFLCVFIVTGLLGDHDTLMAMILVGAARLCDMVSELCNAQCRNNQRYHLLVVSRSIMFASFAVLTTAAFLLGMKNALLVVGSTFLAANFIGMLVDLWFVRHHLADRKIAGPRLLAAGAMVRENWLRGMSNLLNSVAQNVPRYAIHFLISPQLQAIYSLLVSISRLGTLLIQSLLFPLLAGLRSVGQNPEKLRNYRRFTFGIALACSIPIIGGWLVAVQIGAVNRLNPEILQIITGFDGVVVLLSTMLFFVRFSAWNLAMIGLSQGSQIRISVIALGIMAVLAVIGVEGAGMWGAAAAESIVNLAVSMTVFALIASSGRRQNDGAVNAGQRHRSSSGDGVPRRVMLVGTDPHYLLRFRREVIERLVGSGAQVITGAWETPPDVREGLAALGVHRHVELPVRQGSMSITSDFRLLMSLRRTMARERPDWVIGYTAKPVVWGMIAAWLTRVPHRVALVEGLGYAFTPGKGLRRRIARCALGSLYAVALRCANRIVVLNDDDVKDLSDITGVAPSRMKVLGGIGVSESYFRDVPLPQGPVRFMFVGRLLVDKGVRELLDAGRILRERGRTFDLELVGPYDSNPALLPPELLEKMVAQAGAIYHGPSSDVPAELERAHVLVLPSYREGYPRVVMEAMARARPAIATDVPGCNAAVVDGDNGLLVPVRDAESLADAMERFIDDPHLAERMANSAYRHAREHFDAGVRARDLLRLIGFEEDRQDG